MRKYKIAQVNFDTDGNKRLAKELSKEYVGKTLEVNDDELSEDEAQEDVMNAVSDQSGWCIFGIELEKVN